MRRRSALLILVALLIIAAAGWSFAWSRLADRMRDEVAAWAGARRAEGLTVEYEQAAIEGFPFKWHVVIAHPHIAGAGPTGWSWTGEAVEADVVPWSGRDIPLRFPGEHRFAVGQGDVAETWTVSAARPLAHAGLDERGRLDRLDLDLGDVTFVRVTTQQTGQAKHVAGHAQLHRGPGIQQTGADHQTNTFDLALAADDVLLPQAPVAVLGPQVAHAEMDISFKGRLPAGNLPSAVSVWRDDGGTVEINRLAVRWGPIDADGNGTLALDENNRPLGAFTARWRGYNETIDILVSLGEVRPMQAAAAKIALNALARQNSGGVNEVHIPLTAQDGRLFVAGFPLLPIPAISFE
jgi:hypothetical protein